MYCVLTEIAVPTVVVIRTFVSEEDQFTISSFPPLLCTDQESNFYNTFIPRNFFALMCIGMLVVTGWVIHRVSC